jgi:hypothetical protein
MWPMAIGMDQVHHQTSVLPFGLDCRQMEPILSRTVGTTDAHLDGLGVTDLALRTWLYGLGFKGLDFKGPRI